MMTNENMYSQQRVRKPSLIPWVAIFFVIINLIVFIYESASGATTDIEHLLDMGASYGPYIVDGHQYYRLITHFFLHAGPDHLVNNMISLMVLGYATENMLGRVRFFTLYFLSGIAAGIASVYYNMNMVSEPSVSVGASGAIFGLSGALLVLLIYRNRKKLITEAPRFLIYMGLSLYSGYLDPSIDHAAHMGGFVFGGVMCVVFLVAARMRKK